ncbi:MAG: transposase [Pyrinomonadaceae bacterium]
MTRISFDTPCYFFTSVTHHRLPIFRTDQLKEVLANAFDEARRSSGISIFSYVIMPEHFHIVTDSKRSPSDSLRFLNGISARRVIDHLKENRHESSLEKLRQAKKKDGWQYSVWEHHSDKFLVTSESMFMQKVNYVHLNPVKDALVEHPDEYLYSSSRIWNRRPLEVEPLKVDIGEIAWKRG